ncbi:acetolactate decarboxylase [Paenibacillus chartarius]|uniref:Alpha-acetolactate decarboxylase n=1 Tax=Paenibacillus chartarius TaxID=747481 RepID=A0ABV6DHX1_9BACL
MNKKFLVSSVAVLAVASVTTISAFAAEKDATAAKPAKAVEQSQDKGANKKDNTLFQYSTINALMQGQFDGELSLGEVAKHGDTGLGTFNGVNGELTQIDGKFYRFDNDGHFEEVGKDELTPFVSSVKFQSEKTIEVGTINDITELTAILANNIDKKNNFYAFKVHGTFNYLKARSEPKQEKPFKTLPEVLANQSIWEYENVTGTLVVFYTPNYAAMFNVPGYHYHFVSDDRAIGGHILNLKMQSGTAEIDSIGNLEVQLPQTPEFNSTDLTQVDPQDVHDVETDPQ